MCASAIGIYIFYYRNVSSSKLLIRVVVKRIADSATPKDVYEILKLLFLFPSQ